MKSGGESWPWSCQCELWSMKVYMDVSLQCLQFAWYLSGGRCRFCVAVTRVAVYGVLNFASVNAVKTVERSNLPKRFPDSAVFPWTLQRFATTPQCGNVARRRTAIKLSGDALGSTWIDAIDEQPQHCLEIETRAMHCAQSRACSSSALTRVDRRSLTRAHDSAHCKKILAPVTKYGCETRY